MEKMFYENKSAYGFDDTISRLSDIIVKSGWKVSYIHDLQDTMRKNGVEVASVKVIELCNPNYSYRILSDDTLRIYSNMLPCRISVYEKADGKTYVSRMNFALMAAQIGGIVQEVMSVAYHDVEGYIEQIIEK
ncbi:MAG: DUF302 domain-containing protein [Dysgonamonadaceae bacterium]